MVCLHTCQCGLLYLSFPMTVSFYHEERSFNLSAKVQWSCKWCSRLYLQEKKKWKKIQMFFQAWFTETCQSNELSILAQCKNRITSTVLLLLCQCKNGLDEQLYKFLGAVTNKRLYCNILLCCSRGQYGFRSHLLGTATDQVPRTSQE